MNEERYPVAQGVLQPIAGGIVGAVVLYRGSAGPN